MAEANSPTPDTAEAQRPEITPEITPKQRAEGLMTGLTRDKSITEIFGDAFRKQYRIGDKTPEQWERYFRITLPENPSPPEIVTAVGKLASLYQEASFMYAVAEAQVDALSSGESREFTSSFNRLVAEYREAGRSLPASKTLETMAKNEMLDMTGARDNAKIIKNFWKRILEQLTELRKLMEQATWNNHITARQEQFGGGGNIPSHQPDRGSFGRSSST
jgi:hypothetical protein